jgi:hypothetical protein
MTTRSLYAWLISKHPLPFREQFGAEMLEMFERRRAYESAIPFLIDATISLFRQ